MMRISKLMQLFSGILLTGLALSGCFSSNSSSNSTSISSSTLVPQITGIDVLNDEDFIAIGVDDFSLSDIILEVTFDDQSIVQLPALTSMISETDLSKLSVTGEHAITINYEDFSTNLLINLMDPSWMDTLVAIHQFAISRGETSLSFVEWVDSIKGQDAADVQMRVTNDVLEWQRIGDEDWIPLVSLTDLQGDSIELQIADGSIQWKYLSESTWYDLIDLQTLTGKDAREVIFQVSEGYLQWQYVGDEVWTNLLSLATLAGEDGVNGESVELQVSDGYIQWKNYSDDTWNNLVELNSLTYVEGKSAYEIYVEYFPEYSGTEEQWLNDLINGLLGNDRLHVVTFVDYNGVVLSTQKVEDGTAAIAPQNPYREGYVFVKWNIDFSSIIDDTVVIAQYALPTYQVSFDSLVEDLLIDSREVTINQTVTAPSITRSGYVLEGWYISYNNGLTFDERWSFSSDIITTDIVLYAKWLPAVYSISFESNQGSTVDSASYAYWMAPNIPLAPTRQGYQFAGWFQDIDLQYPFDFSQVPSENVTLYAKWIINTYQLSFDSTGGSYIDITYLDYNTPLGELPIPTRSGYSFAGWYDVRSQNQILNITSMPSRDVEVFAKWEVNTYTLTVDYGTSQSTYDYHYKQDLNLYNLVAEQEGFVFKNWVDVDGNIIEFSTMPSRDLTILPKYAPIYTFDYELHVDGSLTLTGLNIDPQFIDFFSLEIPSMIGELPVNHIDDYAFSDITQYNKVYIPKEIKTIGLFAFAFNNQLQEVIFEDESELQLFGFGSLSGTSRLRKIVLPYVGESPDSSYYFTLGFIFGNHNYDFSYSVTQYKNTYYIPLTLSEIVVQDDNILMPDAFRGLYNVVSLAITEDTTSVSYGILCGMNKLKTLVVPFVGSHRESILSNGVFHYLFGNQQQDNMLAVYVPNYGNFYVSPSLESLTVLSDSTIENYAFYGYNSLKQITINGSTLIDNTLHITSDTASIGEYSFNGLTGIQNILIEGNFTSIPQYAFGGMSSLIELNVPSTITTIGSYAFSSLTSLQVLTLNTGLITIADGAFSYNSSVLSLSIPEGVKNIYANSFGNMSSVKSLWLPNSIETIATGSFSNYNALETVNIPFVGTSLISNTRFGSIFSTMPPKLTTVIIRSKSILPSSAFSGYSTIKQLVIGGTEVIPETLHLSDGFNGLSSYAFSGLSSIKEIQFNDDITIIPDNTFNGMSSITELNIPSSLTNIGSYAFSNMTGMVDLYIPDTVTRIGNGAFTGMSSLESINLPFMGSSSSTANAAEKVFGYVFDCTSRTDKTDCITNSVTGWWNYSPQALTSVVIRSANSIPSGAFINYSHIHDLSIGTSNILPNTINMGETVVSLSSYAFSGMSGIANINLSTALTSISDYSLTNMSSLNTIVIPSSVTTIGSYALSGNTALTSITIPNSVTAIGSYAFSNNSSVTELYIPNSVTSIGNSAFRGMSGLQSINLPYLGLSTSSTLGQEKVFGAIFGYTSSNAPGTIYNDGVGGYYYIPLSLKTVIIRNVTELPNGAFSRISSIEQLSLGTETTIDDSLIIGDGISSLGMYSFNYLTNIQKIEFNNDITLIPTGAFSYMTGLSSLTLPSGIQTINSHAFSYLSNVTELYVPDSVTSIGSSSFIGMSQLTSIDLPYMGLTANTNSLSSADKVLGAIFGYTTSSGGTTYNIGTGYWYYLPTQLQKVVIRSSTQLPAGAFAGLSSVTELVVNGTVITPNTIVIGEGVTTIGSYAFTNMTSATQLVLPESLQSFQPNALRGLNGLVSIELPFIGISPSASTAQDKVFAAPFGYTSTNTTGTIVNTQTGYYYYVPTTLRRVVINTVANVPNGAFMNLNMINEITLNDNQSTVNSLIIQEGVISIGNAAFYGLSNIESVFVPDSTTLIGSRAFYGLSNIKHMSLPFIGLSSSSTLPQDNVMGALFGYETSNITGTTYNLATGYYYYVPTTLDSVIIRNQVNVPIGAFYGFNSVTQLSINNSSLTAGSLVISNNVTSLGTYAFYGMSSITDISIGSSVSILPNQVFSNMSSLAEITIPSTITSISTGALEGLSRLTTVYVDSLTIIENYGFNYGLSQSGNLYLDASVSPNSYIVSNFTSVISDIPGYSLWVKN